MNERPVPRRGSRIEASPNSGRDSSVTVTRAPATPAAAPSATARGHERREVGRPAVTRSNLGAARSVYGAGVVPEERVRWVVETARAVLDGRLAAAEGASAVEVQRDQLADLLRRDRDLVTRRECESVATTLRLLAEQVGDAAPTGPAGDEHRRLAASIGLLAVVLR